MVTRRVFLGSRLTGALLAAPLAAEAKILDDLASGTGLAPVSVTQW
jgi:hypothetical protein